MLCAILFPVFAAAKGGADRTLCMSNMRQLTAGTHLYGGDYDDRFMPVNHQPAAQANSRNDRTWVQLVLPYVRSFSVFSCPSDTLDHVRPEATFDQDLVPGDTYSQYYTASQHVNYGYNYQNLAPVILEGDIATSRPRDYSEIRNPGSTLIFVDSVWSRSDSGDPIGGGSWLVVPPCRYYASRIDSFTGAPAHRVAVFTTTLGWNTVEQAAPNFYGNAWPWHRGRMNVAFMDGAVHSMAPKELEVGCAVAPNWHGTITSPDSYVWDIR